MLLINELNRLYLGIQGENEARTIEIDCSAWMVAYPNGSISIWHKRNGDVVPAPTGAAFDSDSGILSWTPTDTDTFVSGEGVAEVRLTQNGVIKKSRAVITGVSASVTGAGMPLGSDWQSYINEVERIKGLAVAAKDAAEDAAEDAENISIHPPYINLGTYRWMIWDTEQDDYVDSGISAQGVPGPQGVQGVPGIQGPRGSQGIQGVPGIQGPRGDAGARGEKGDRGDAGEAFTIAKVYDSVAEMEEDFDTCGLENGKFVIVNAGTGEEDNGKVYEKTEEEWMFIVKMEGVPGPKGDRGDAGPQGVPGIQGERGETGPQGIQGIQGIPGPAGPGVPSGGTAGQYLRKNSGTDYDTDWESPVNNATETQAGKVLDARMGKTLSEAIETVADSIGTVPEGETVEGQISSLSDQIANRFKTISSGSLHDIKATGMYYLTGGVTDKPVGTGGYYSVIAYNNDLIVGLYSSADGRTFQVQYTGGQWASQEFALNSKLIKSTTITISSVTQGYSRPQYPSNMPSDFSVINVVGIMAVGASASDIRLATPHTNGFYLYSASNQANCDFKIWYIPT